VASEAVSMVKAEEELERLAENWLSIAREHGVTVHEREKAVWRVKDRCGPVYCFLKVEVWFDTFKLVIHETIYKGNVDDVDVWLEPLLQCNNDCSCGE